MKTKWLARQRRLGRDEWYLRRGPWKLILDETRVRLFHLPTDPDESTDVRDEHALRAAALANVLMARTPGFASGESGVPPLDEGLSADQQRELEEALESLGYLE